MKLFLNNALTHSKEAMVSVFDHGFLYGIGLFETFRTYNGKPFLLREHLKRLALSCKELGIAFAVDETELNMQISTLLKENNLADGYFRLTISAGEDELGLPVADYNKPTTILMCKALPPAKSAKQWSKGKTVVCLKTLRNTPESNVRYKSLHYMNNLIAKRELRLEYPAEFAFAEGLMLNEKGHLTEGIVSNIFFRKGSIIHTPAISTGILPGITRAFVIELCRQEGYMVEEGYYSWDSLLEADEIWLTNSIQEITAVTSIATNSSTVKIVANGEAGSYAKHLNACYQNYINQIK